MNGGRKRLSTLLTSLVDIRNNPERTEGTSAMQGIRDLRVCVGVVDAWRVMTISLLLIYLIWWRRTRILQGRVVGELIGMIRQMSRTAVIIDFPTRKSENLWNSITDPTHHSLLGNRLQNYYREISVEWRSFGKGLDKNCFQVNHSHPLPIQIVEQVHRNRHPWC